MSSALRRLYIWYRLFLLKCLCISSLDVEVDSEGANPHGFHVYSFVFKKLLTNYI